MNKHMKHLQISGNEYFVENSAKFEVHPTQKYKASTTIIARSCKPYTFMFIACFLDSNGLEICRKYRWISETGNESEEYTIVFSTTSRTKSVVLGYRVNMETPFTGYCELDVQEISSIDVIDVPNHVEEVYDLPFIQVPQLSPLTTKDEHVLEQRMVWILGYIRSGTTWLGRDLLQHKTNVYWHEPYLGWHLDVIKEWHWGREEYFFSYYHKHNWLPWLKKLILERTYSQVQTLEKNVIIKEPNGSGSAETIMQCFPDSKLIFLLRDGRDVVDSILDAHQPNSWNADNPITKFEPILGNEMRDKVIKQYSSEWVRITKAVWQSYSNHNPKLRLLVKYENLLENTFYELKKIYQFLEINILDAELHAIIKSGSFDNIPSSQKGSGKFYRSASPGSWKKNLSQHEKALMHSIMSDTLVKMDYNV